MGVHIENGPRIAVGKHVFSWEIIILSSLIMCIVIMQFIYYKHAYLEKLLSFCVVNS